MKYLGSSGVAGTKPSAAALGSKKASKAAVSRGKSVAIVDAIRTAQMTCIIATRLVIPTLTFHPSTTSLYEAFQVEAQFDHSAPTKSLHGLVHCNGTLEKVAISTTNAHVDSRLIRIFAPLSSQKPFAHTVISDIDEERLVGENLYLKRCVVPFNKDIPCS